MSLFVAVSYQLFSFAYRTPGNVSPAGKRWSSNSQNPHLLSVKGQYFEGAFVPVPIKSSLCHQELDKRGRIEFVGRAGLRSLGRDGAGLLGGHWKSLERMECLRGDGFIFHCQKNEIRSSNTML